jgi:hypothetical protein
VCDDAPVDPGDGVPRQNPVLESRVREKGRVLSEHLLAVLRSLESPERTFEISTHSPRQRATPFGQANFGKVIQSSHEALFAGAGKLTEFCPVWPAGDFEGPRLCLGRPRSAQDSVKRRESCLSHFAALGFLNVKACTIPELQCAQAFGMPANTLLHILSRETERLAVRHATKDNMHMRMFRVPVNDARPFQRPTDVTFDGGHDVSCQPFQV